MANVTRYNLARFVFDDTEIITNKFKTTRKLKVEKLTATNSHTAYAVMFGEEEIDWDIDEIDPLQRPFFENIMQRQKEDPTILPMISTYDYSEISGDAVEDDVFADVWVEEISKENANKPFSAKGGAKRIVPKIK